jgi:hypothetical protein
MKFSQATCRIGSSPGTEEVEKELKIRLSRCIN